MSQELQDYCRKIEAEQDRLRADNERLRGALEMLLPGLILDLRYADEDDDKDAMRCRIETVTDALAGKETGNG